MQQQAIHFKPQESSLSGHALKLSRAHWQIDRSSRHGDCSGQAHGLVWRIKPLTRLRRQMDTF
ncbi:hypothetical protein PSCICL_23700 [Pseudomonas cichorii]|nr:hypothetical protein PSCICG_17210 [Pseudomonas cichorii]GFM71378.1 hypothetical protein PSCICL_23700 [Pseudomonas cichorii]